MRLTIVIVTPVAVAVVAADSTTVVALVTEAIVVDAGMPAPVTALPLSVTLNANVALVSEVSVFVTPSATERTTSFIVVEQGSNVVRLLQFSGVKVTPFIHRSSG